MKYLELKQNIKNEILPVYTVIGNDDYLISNAIKIIKKSTVDQAQEINFDVFNDENYDIQAIFNSTQQLAFISNRRLLVVYLPEKVKKDDIELLTNYTLNPNLDVVLVIVDKQEVFKKGEIIDCNRLNNQDLLKVVPNLLKKYNKTITADGANFIIEVCQNDTMKISKELEKLAFYCENELIRREDIEQIIKPDLQFEVFKLINYIAVKNKNMVMKQINSLLDNKQDVMGVISLISLTFRRMFYCKISNLPTQELADKFGVKPYAISKAKENANSFSQKQLKKILEICEEVDYLTKQSQLSPSNALHVLVFSILII